MSLNERIARGFPWVALPLGIGLLQWHGAQFWMQWTGPVWGAVASGTVEWLNLWAWWSERRATGELGAAQTRSARAAVAGRMFGWSLVAILTTVLLVGAPLYQVGGKVLVAERANLGTASVVTRTDAALETLMRASERGRKVGQQIVDLTQEANQAEASLYGADLKGGKTLPGLERAILAAQCLVLLLELSVVVAIRDLAGQRSHSRPLSVTTERGFEFRTISEAVTGRIERAIAQMSGVAG